MRWCWADIHQLEIALLSACWSSNWEPYHTYPWSWWLFGVLHPFDYIASRILHFISTPDKMDNDYLETPASPQQTNTRQNISVRQPVSCEPCRHRKIKCSRTKPVCDTCRRRGCADRCVYKGTRDGDTLNPTASPNEVLLNRISNLEQLLRKHTGAEIPGRGPDYSMMPSPPVEMGQTSQLSPESFISETSHQTYSSDYQSPLSGGVLTSTSSGNVRYEPRSSQWTSVLSNTNLSIDTPSLDEQEDSNINFGFPFTDSSVPTTDELLYLLPPMQQCDYLKNQYFAVFSPVCAHFILLNI